MMIDDDDDDEEEYTIVICMYVLVLYSSTILYIYNIYTSIYILSVDALFVTCVVQKRAVAGLFFGVTVLFLNFFPSAASINNKSPMYDHVST
jgi:hypothetical protein